MRFLILNLLLSFSISLTAQIYEAPLLHCLQVDAADEVTLTWLPVANTSGTFLSYNVWRTNSTGVFQEEITGIAATTVLDPSASVNEVENYQIEAVYDSSGFTISRFSTTVSTMNPTAQLITGNGTFVYMDWVGPLGDNSALLYLGYEVQINVSGIWETVATLPIDVVHYEYKSDICVLPAGSTTPVDFRVIATDIYGCTSTSVIRDDRPLKDDNAPEFPVIETVTIDTTFQKAEVCWFPVPDVDIAYYTIQYSVNNPNFSMRDAGEVTAPATSLIIDGPSTAQPHYNVTLQSVGYVVIATDDCTLPLDSAGNGTSFFDCLPHHTIYLDREFDKCARATRLEWTAYEGWEGGVESYVIFGRPGPGPMQVIDTVPPGQTAYVHEDVPIGGYFEYMIKAISVNGFKPSLSIIGGVYTDYPDRPNFTYLANASVVAPKRVELKALVDLSAVGTRYRFEKLNRFGDTFQTLGMLPQSAADPDGYLTLYDFEALTASKSHDYRVVSVDSCGNDHEISPVSSNMLAIVTTDNAALTNTISWSAYRHWEGEVIGYNVYQVQGGIIGDLLFSVPPDVRTVVHTVDMMSDYIGDAQYCYVVEAIEALDPYGLDQTAFSNVVCAAMEPLMFIPNAITPNGDGLNDFFAPVGGYFDRNDGYAMVIYDRWGQVIYETDNYYKPWRALDGDGVVQEGVYVYHITFRTGGGELYERYGNITVLLAKSE